MRNLFTRLPRTLVFLWLALLAAPAVCQTRDLEQHLRDQYKGKTLLLRSFPAGERLTYDSSGALTSRPSPGDWTVTGVVRVNKLRISKNRLIADATRFYLLPTASSGLQPTPDGSLQIQADLGPGKLGPDEADAVMSRIFLTAQDDFAALVPDYWKFCVLVGLSADAAQTKTGCRFSPEFMKIPGVVLRPGKGPTPQELFAEAADTATRFDKGVKPPKKIFGSEPAFSEEARRQHYQGIVTLGVVVNKNGDVQKIWIISPLGHGLDFAAMDAVSRWKFEPARKGGQPVAAQVVIETNFHLYN